MKQQGALNLSKYTTDKSNTKLIYVRPVRTFDLQRKTYYTFYRSDIRRNALFLKKLERIGVILSKIDNPVIPQTEITKMIKIIIEQP
jgi:hypothetical protein